MLTQVELLALGQGLCRSLLVSLIGIAAALLIGTVLGAVRHAGIPVASQLTSAYVNGLRCTPLLVQIFMLYFALPEIGIRLSPFDVAILSLSLWGGAYQVEVMRAGFDAVSRQQVLCARALGLSGLDAFLRITLPLGLRIALPSATTTALSQFRSSSFMLVVGYQELTYVGNQIASETFEVLRVFSTVSLIYLAVSFGISSASRGLERLLSVPGLGRP